MNEHNKRTIRVSKQRQGGLRKGLKAHDGRLKILCKSAFIANGRRSYTLAIVDMNMIPA